MSNKEIIRLKKIGHIYNPGEVSVVSLSDISLEINQGEFIAITGPSGAGKSTLLHIIGLLLQPTSGSYQIYGRETAELGKDTLAITRNTTFGFVFQSFNLLPRATAIQNVVLPLIYAGIARKERILRAKDMLHQVGLEHRLKHRPNELSGGEQQRVAIARALVNHPDIIVADEPTGNLDSSASIDIIDIFEKQVEKGITVIFVSHDQTIISRAPKQIILKDGRLKHHT